MSQIYIFHDQAGVIPGVPGVFSHCTVEIDDEGGIRIFDAKGERYTGPDIEPIADEEPMQEPPAMPIEEQPIVTPIPEENQSGG